MEDWILEHKKKLRKELGPGIEIKNLGKSLYVYKSTTYWDKTIKRRRKTSKYLGSLNEEKGLIPSSGKVITRFAPKTIKRYGSVELIHKALEDLIPSLKELYPDYWEELYALAIIRLLKQAPIKRTSSVWEGLNNKLGISPKLSPKTVSSILREIGADRISQNDFYVKMMIGKSVFAYDLSVIFTRSEGINFAERGYNEHHIALPQIHLVLLNSIDEELPAAMKVIPGSVQDIPSLYVTLEELPLKDKILIMDRGFHSEDIIKTLVGKSISYVIPTRRTSVLYLELVHLNSHLFYNKRLIKCGKKKMDGYFIYIFEDNMLKMEEERKFYEKIDLGLAKKTDQKKARFGKILILSNLDKKPEEIFHLYKKRDEVEKSFDAFKNVLDADRMYLQDNESVFGHIFVSFLSLYAYSKIRALLKKADLLKKYSVEDVLEEYDKVYVIQDESRQIISEIPNKVRKLDEGLGTNLFPKLRS